jgi:uncharacterized protein HemX
MTRRGAGLILVVVLALALVGVGWWRRAQLMDERDAARTARTHALATFARTQIELETTIERAGALETESDALRRQADELQRTADGVATQVAAVSKERDDDVVAAYAANGLVGTLRACLDGINRALNQVSVGDPGSVRTLDSVRSACRAVS